MKPEIEYEYFAFKKLHEEHKSNLSRLAMILRTSRTRVYRMIDRMKRDDALIERAIKEYLENK